MIKKIKYLFIGLLSLSLFFVVSCSNDDNKQNNTPSDNPSTDIEEELNEFKDIYFENETFDYDGKTHSLKVSGDIPQNTKITYSNNDKVDAGIYEVKAKLECEKYKTKTLIAYLTINKIDYELNGISFLPKTCVYDGKEKEVTISGTLPESVRVIYENNKLTNAGVVTATAHFISNNPNYNNIEPITTTLKIEKADFNINNIKFNDKVVTYDENLHEIVIDEELPIGVSVKYENNRLISAGSTLAKAIFSVNLKNYNPLKENTLIANLTIEKANYDLSNFSFLPKSYIYDGIEKEMVISGELPKGVRVSYENNKLTNAGEIIAIAHFMSDNPNYNDIPDMSATLKIEKATYDLSNTKFEDKEFTYDGTEKELLISGDLPQGVKVTYLNNKLTNPGKITATAIFTTDNLNYNDIPNMTATLCIIEPITKLEGITLTDKTFYYDGSEKKLLIEGILPEDVFAVYEDNIRYDVGTNLVTVRFESDDPKYKYLKPLTTNLTVEVKGLKYRELNRYVELYEYDEKTDKLYIPIFIDGKQVVFANNLFKNTQTIKEIYVENALLYDWENVALNKDAIIFDKSATSNAHYSNNEIQNVIVSGYTGKTGITDQFKWSYSYVFSGYIIYDYLGDLEDQSELFLPKLPLIDGRLPTYSLAYNFEDNKALDVFGGDIYDYSLDLHIPHNDYDGYKSITTDGLKYYYKTDGTVAIYKYTGNSKKIIIPQTIDGKKVSEIQKNTFKDNDLIEEVYINEKIIVDRSCVCNCKNLIVFTKEKYEINGVVICSDYINKINVINNIKYAIIDTNEIIILKYLGNDKEIVLEETIEGKAVIKVLERAIPANCIIFSKTDLNYIKVDVRYFTGEKGETTSGLKWAKTTNGIVVYDYNIEKGNEVYIPELIEGNSYTINSNIFEEYSNLIIFDSTENYFNTRENFVINNFSGEKGITENGLYYAIDKAGKCIIYNYIKNDESEVVIPSEINGHEIVLIRNKIFKDYEDLLFSNSTNIYLNYQNVINDYAGKSDKTDNGLYYALTNNGEAIIYKIITNENQVEIPVSIKGYKTVLKITKKPNDCYLVYEEGFFAGQQGKRFDYGYTYCDNYAGVYGIYDGYFYVETTLNTIAILDYYNTSSLYINVPKYINDKLVTSFYLNYLYHGYIYISSTIETITMREQFKPYCVFFSDKLNPNIIANNQELKYVEGVSDNGLFIKNNFICYLNNDELFIVDSISRDATLIIPNKIADYDIYGLSDYAFSAIIYGPKYKNIYIEEGMSSIGKGVLSNRSMILKLYIPKTIETIGDNSFDYVDIVYAKCDVIDFYTTCRKIYWNYNEEKITEDGFKYYVHNNYAIITEYLGDEKMVNIPLTINGYITNINKMTVSLNLRRSDFTLIVRKTDRITDYINEFRTLYANDLTEEQAKELNITYYNYGGKYGIINNYYEWYLTNDNTITIFNTKSNAKNINYDIPSYIENFPVTKISCNIEPALETGKDIFIKIPETVLEISNSSFMSSDLMNTTQYIISLYIPSTVKIINNVRFGRVVIFAEPTICLAGWNLEQNYSEFRILYDSKGGIHGIDNNLYWYLKNNNKATIYSNNQVDTLTVPNKIKDYQVNSIKEIGGNVKNIIIAEGIETIEDNAFTITFNFLQKIYIPSSIINMGHNIFDYNHNINVYCASPSKPESWNDDWYGNVPSYLIKWNYKYENLKTNIKSV